MMFSPSSVLGMNIILFKMFLNTFKYYFEIFIVYA